jgi:RimJ/RimL family protein N-acetyltransferase
MEAPRIETPRLVLRGTRPEDFDPFCAAMADDAFARFITRERRALTPAECWPRLCGIAGNWQVRGYGMFMIEEKASGALVGQVGPWEPFGWPAFEIGWSIFPVAQGRGYAAEAAAAAFRYAYDVLGRREAIHLIHPDNDASARVARSMGARPAEMWTPFWEGGDDLRIWRSRWDDFLGSSAFARLAG